MPHDIRASAPRVFVVLSLNALAAQNPITFLGLHLLGKTTFSCLVRASESTMNIMLAEAPFPCSFVQVTHRPMQQGDSFPIHWEIVVTPPHGTWGEWTFHHTRFLNYATALVTNCTSAWTWELVNPLSLPVEDGALFTFSQFHKV